ncbi:MAG: hypothetical protein AB7S26_15620 [Sandaracinaceae bacterium]
MAGSPAPRPIRVKHTLALAAMVAACALVLVGCPRQPDAPPPGMGTPCEQLEDCNPTASCGLLTQCVDGFCEETSSLVRPCPGVGEPLRQ